MSPTFEKSPPWLIELFDHAIAGTAIERRTMFGCPCGFVAGQMCCGLFGKQLFVRLPEADRARALALEGAAPFDPMGGRPMKEYVVLAESLLEDEDQLRGWVARAAAYAQTLPPKQRRKGARRRKRA